MYPGGFCRGFILYRDGLGIRKGVLLPVPDAIQDMPVPGASSGVVFFKGLARRLSCCQLPCLNSEEIGSGISCLFDWVDQPCLGICRSGMRFDFESLALAQIGKDEPDSPPDVCSIIAPLASRHAYFSPLQ